MSFTPIVKNAAYTTKVGTPVDNQIGVWTGNGTIEGDASLTFDTTTDTLTTGKVNATGMTASEIAITDASKNIVSASVATYPSLTELTYVKGVTSAIQTQLGGKQSTITFGTGVQAALGVNVGAVGAPVLFNGALGTPSSATLTNATGLPVAGITGSTTTALGVGSIELGHASDTTLSRVSAGVVAVEGKNVALNGTSETFSTGTIELGHASDTTISRSAAGVIAVEGVVIPSISSTNTLTNKRVTPRVSSETSSATPTINTDNVDAHSITALATAITSMTTNLSGTPTNFQKLIIRIKDDGTARAITWGASFEAKGVALPTTTVISKVLTVGFIYDTVTSKWGCVASVSEA